MYSREEYSAALDETAYELLHWARIDRPPVDALRVAERLGMVVASDRRQTERARLVRLAVGAREARPAILLRSEPRAERRQFAVAHEIGEHTAAQLFARLNVDPCEVPPPAREAAANHLAGRLLLPTDWLAVAALACDWDLTRLKERFATASHELIARRMLDFSLSVILAVFDQGQRTWRQGNAWGPALPWSPAEQSCWLEAHETGQPCETLERCGRVRAWAIHEPAWKREIVRFEPAHDESETEEVQDDLLHAAQWVDD